MQRFESVVLALTSDERYFPGLYCAVASALSAGDPAREIDVKVLDGGLSQASRDAVARLIERTGKRARLGRTVRDRITRFDDDRLEIFERQPHRASGWRRVSERDLHGADVSGHVQPAILRE